MVKLYIPHSMEGIIMTTLDILSPDDSSHQMESLHVRMLSDVLKYKRSNPSLNLPQKRVETTLEPLTKVEDKEVEIEKASNLLNNLKNSAIVNFSKVLNSLKDYRMSLHPSYTINRLSEDRIVAEGLATEAYERMTGIKIENKSTVLAEDGLREDGMIFYVDGHTVFWIKESNRWDYD